MQNLHDGARRQQLPSRQRVLKLATAVFVVLCGVLIAFPVWAFESCTVRQLDSRPSELPMDGSDPVAIGSNVYMAYTTGNSLMFLSSNDNGITFATQDLADGTEISPVRPRIAASGKHVYVAWLTNAAGAGQLVFRQSADYGATFGPRLVLGPAKLSTTPSIAASGLGVTIVFAQVARNGVIIASSADGGITWPDAPALTIAGSFASENWVARLGRRIIVGWSEFQPANRHHSRTTYIAVSAGGGKRFTMKTLTPGPAGASERQVAVSPTTGIWYINAQDFADVPPGTGLGAYNVLWTSRDRGSSWTRQIVATNSINQMMAVSGSTIYLTWRQFLPDGSSRIYLTYSPDDGQTWAAPSDLSGPTGTADNAPDGVYLPELSVKGETLFSEVYVSQGTVLVRSTHDIGKGMSAPFALGPGTNPMIAGGSVLWLGPGAGQNQAVFYAHCE